MNVVTLGKSLGLLKQLTDPTQATEPIVVTPPQKPEFEPSADDSVYAIPESEGISSRMLAEYITEVYNNKSINVQDIIVARNGKNLLEIGFDARDTETWKCTFSQCKSITGLAVGMLIDDGVITESTTLADIFGKRIPALHKGKAKEITVLHLLTMSAGAVFNEAQCMTTDNWIKGFFTSGWHFDAGERFNYNSLNTYMLSAVVSALTGKTLSAFLDERLFGPLSITNYYWEKCPRGIDKGGWGLYIKPWDMVKIGQLLIDKGIWQGKRIISEEYISRATSKRIDVPSGVGDYDYGFQIWTARDFDGFLFNGMLGQNLFCFRESGIIIAVNSGNTDTFQQNDIFRITHKYFNREFEDALPRDIFGELKLKKTVRELSRFRPRRNRHLYERIFRKKNIAKWCGEICGEYTVTSKDAVSVGVMPVLMQVVQNNYTKGAVAYRFDTGDGRLWLTCAENGCEVRLPVGFDDAIVEYTDIMGEKCCVATTGEFRYNEDDLLVLKVKIDFLEYPYSRMLKFIFEGDRLKVRYTETPGRELLYGFDVVGLTKKLPAVFSSLTQAGAEQVITKLGNSFERTVYAEKMQNAELRKKKLVGRVKNIFIQNTAPIVRQQ